MEHLTSLRQFLFAYSKVVCLSKYNDASFTLQLVPVNVCPRGNVKLHVSVAGSALFDMHVWGSMTVR